MRCGIVFLVAMALASPSLGGEKFASREGRFRVAFPGETKVEKTTVEGIQIQSIETKVEKDKEFVVWWGVLPEEAKEIPTKTLLDNAQKGSLESSKGKLVQSKDISFGALKFPARELYIETDKTKFRTLIVLANSRVIVAIAGGPGEYVHGKAVKAFFESIEIDH